MAICETCRTSNNGKCFLRQRVEVDSIVDGSKIRAFENAVAMNPTARDCEDKLKILKEILRKPRNKEDESSKISKVDKPLAVQAFKVPLIRENRPAKPETIPISDEVPIRYHDLITRYIFQERLLGDRPTNRETTRLFRNIFESMLTNEPHLHTVIARAIQAAKSGNNNS